MKAMLAYSQVPALDDLRLPLWASYKLDGIRCLMINGKAMSRTNKPIPNKFVQHVLGNLQLHGLDGELMLRTGDFNSAQSAFMSVEGKPDFYLAVFDSFHANLDRPFKFRLQVAREEVDRVQSNRVVYVEHYPMLSKAGVELLYEEAIEQGYEGLILRDPGAPYKLGRSTLKQQWMLKLKPEEDAEGIIVGFEELMHNTDTSTKMQQNMVGGNTLGSFLVAFRGGTVNIGTGKGLTHVLRKKLWLRRQELLGKKITFSYQELSKYGVPRFPRFKGIREDL